MAALERGRAQARAGVARRPRRSRTPHRASACGNGRWRRSGRAGWCPGLPSHSAAGSSSISPPTGSRPSGRRSRFAVAASVAAVLARRRPVAFPLVAGLAAAAAGFATATVKRAIIAHPVLSAPVWNAEIAGFVETREERERSDRIVVRVDRIAGAAAQRDARARAGVGAQGHGAARSAASSSSRRGCRRRSSRCGPAATTSRAISISSGIGASGFVLGAHPHRRGAARARRCGCATPRPSTACATAIDKRIRAVVPGDKGAIASALITGKRDAISTPVNEAMYVSGLGARAVDLRLSHGGGGGRSCSSCCARCLR